MKKPALGGRASSVACNPILAPSCLVVDAATSHLHLDLLHKKDTETRLRAITYKGGGLSTIKGNFRDLPKFAEYNFYWVKFVHALSGQIVDKLPSKYIHKKSYFLKFMILNFKNTNNIYK